MKKTIIEEAMIAYVKEMNDLTMKINSSYSKAVKAAHRGDEKSYRKLVDKISEMGAKLKTLEKEFDVIKTAYAAI